MSPQNQSPRRKTNPGLRCGAAHLTERLLGCILTPQTAPAPAPASTPTPSCSYAMTLNLELLSLFCPGHKGPLFFLLDWGPPQPLPDSYNVLLSAQINMSCGGDRRGCPQTDSPDPGITLYNCMHNSTALCQTLMRLGADDGTSRINRRTGI